MGPDATTRRLVSESAERIATYLLVVLVAFLVARTVLDVEPPLNLATFAVVIGAVFLGAQIVRPSTGGWARELGTGISGRQATLLVAGLAVIGAGLRLYALGRPSFWFDEAITTNAAIGLLEHGRPVFPSGAVYWRGFPHTLLVAGSLAGFGLSEWAARFPSVLAGVATIPVVYWLGREVGNRRVGLVTAVLVTVLTWEIAWSRQARMYQLLQLAYAVALLGLARVDRTGLSDRITLGLIGGGTLLAALTHRIGLVLFPVAGGYLALQLWYRGEGVDRRSVAVIGGVVVVAVALELLGTGPLAVTRTVLATDIDHVDRYRGVVRSTLPVVSILAVVGLGLSARYWAHGLLLALALFPPLWVLLFHTELFAMRYLFFAVPILAVSIALVVEVGVEQATDLVRYLGAQSAGLGRRFRRILTRVPPAVLATGLPVVVALLVVLPSLTLVPQAGYALGPNAPQPDFKAAYSYVDSHDQPDDVLVAGWTAPALYYHGSVDYWLVHALTSADQAWTTADRREVYSGAEPVPNASALRRTVDCHPRGWVVFDRIVYRKLDDETLAVLSNLTVHESGAAEMYVYSWEGTGECPADGDVSGSGDQASGLVVGPTARVEEP